MTRLPSKKEIDERQRELAAAAPCATTLSALHIYHGRGGGHGLSMRTARSSRLASSPSRSAQALAADRRRCGVSEEVAAEQ